MLTAIPPFYHFSNLDTLFRPPDLLRRPTLKLIISPFERQRKFLRNPGARPIELGCGVHIFSASFHVDSFAAGDDHHRLGCPPLRECRRPGISKHDASRIQQERGAFQTVPYFSALVTIP
jgi:hypothetical protein